MSHDIVYVHAFRLVGILVVVSDIIINYKVVQGFPLGFTVDSLNFCFILLLSNGCYIV